MKINIRMTGQLWSIAALTYVSLVVPVVAKDKEAPGGKKDSGTPRVAGVPIGTWIASFRQENSTVTGISQYTITISANANERYRETNDLQWKPGFSIGASQTTGALPPAKLMGRNRLRWTWVSYPNKVKRVGDDLYVYMTAKKQLVSSDSDPAGLSFEDINVLGDAGARRLNEAPNSKQTFAVQVYHIQGNNLVHDKDSRDPRLIFERVGSR